MFRISNVALALVVAGMSVKNTSFAFSPMASTTSTAFGISRASSSSPSTAPCDNVSFPFLVTNNDVTTTNCKKRQMQLFMATADEAAAVPSKLVRKPESAVEITLTAPGTATKAAYDKVCAEVSKTISIPGFRKGAKIPPAVIENAMSAKGGRNSLRTQAIQALLNQLLEPALKEEHNLEPIGQPKLVAPVEELAQSFKPGESIEMVVVCDVWPDISWSTVEGKEKPYYGLKASYTRNPFNQARFDQAMKDLAERYAVTEAAPEGKELAMGDSCIVDMTGFMAGEDGKTKGDPLPDAASGDDVEIVLGEGRYMNGLVEGLVGAKVGETRTVYVSFPNGLRDKTLAGKKAVFDVTVKEASIRTVPEIDDELAQRIRPGLDAEGIKNELRKAVDEQDSGEWIEARNKALSKALAEVMDVEVPDTLVTNQAREKYAQMMAEFRTQGMDDEEIKKLITPENFQKYKNIQKQDIVDDFKTSMAADEIARLEGIEVPAYQIDEQLEAVKKEANGEDLGDENMLRTKIESTIMRRMVFDFLAENAELDVQYEEEKFDEELLEKLAKETMEREAKDLKGKEVTNDSKVQVAEDQGNAEAEAKSAAEAEAARLKKEEEERLAAEAEEKKKNDRVAMIAEARRQPKSPEEDKVIAERYAAMDIDERAFQILLDLGMIELTPDPDSPDYDPSEDENLAPENVFSKN
mmetsp:Transcript_14761/g.27763  ORF Transcript_14761/g.27763 Transcript_14761/m.27763 type:complete len:695 (+) Transcript_14761:152-2236(+)